MHPSARHISLMSYCGYSPHQQKSIIKHSGPHQSHKASTQMKRVPCSPKVTPRMTGQGITLLPEQKASPKPSPELHFKPRMPRAGQKSCHRALRQGQQQLCNCLQCSCITPVLCFYELLTARHKKQQPRGRVVSPLPFTHPKEKKVGGVGIKDFVSFRLLHSQVEGGPVAAPAVPQSPAHSLSSLASTINPAAKPASEQETN